MPYNNQPIESADDLTGTSVLPLTRVKKIIAADEDIAQCSNGAAFVISVATEMFIRQLTEQAYNVVKSETQRKTRRNIQYKDLATAVARIDNLEFLSDVIPKTTTFKQFKEKKAREAANGTLVESGQMTLDARRPSSRHHQQQQNGVSETSHDHSAPLNGVMNGTSQRTEYPDILPQPVSPSHQHIPSMNGSPIVDRTIRPTSSHAHPSQHEDVEMSG